MKTSTLRDGIRVSCLGCGKSHALRGFKVVRHEWRDKDGWSGTYPNGKAFDSMTVYSLCPVHDQEVNGKERGRE